jgi:apolipoprotein D and lipocalin family protein
MSVRAEMPVAGAPGMDLSRWVGMCYALATFPMFFRRQCIGDPTAEYRRSRGLFDNRAEYALAGRS